MGAWDSSASSSDASTQMGLDGGQMIPPGLSSLHPGSHIVVGGQRIDLRETYSSVRAKLGMGTRSTTGMNNRSFQYDMGQDGEVTIWFANTGINADPASSIDDKDEVLWIAVTASFGGRTPDGIGMGSTRGEVQAAYGVSPHTAPVTSPPGTLATYYRRGILLAYSISEEVRTITICRAYPVEPDGDLRLSTGELLIGGTTIRGGSIVGGGTSESVIRQTLGDPADAEGTQSLGITNLKILSYAFLGLEVFLTRSGSVFFVSVHSPFYGKSNNVGHVGMERTAFESHLAAEDFQAGTVSSTSNNVYCYQHRRNSSNYVGVTYSTSMPSTVTSITLAMPSSACN